MIIDQSRISHSNKLSKAKEKLTNYETIHDHNLTEGELLTFKNTSSKEKYLKEINYDLDKCYYALSFLYYNRDDKITSDKYFSMISEKKRMKHEKDADDIMALMIP